MFKLPDKYQSLNNLVLDIYQEEYLEMGDGAKLRNLSHRPENPRSTTLIIPGWNSLPVTWGPALLRLADNNHHVEYVESREKYTAELPKNAEFTRERLIQDYEEAVRILHLDRYIVVGSSLSSTILVDAMLYGNVNPQHAILLNVKEFGRFDKDRFLSRLINHLTYHRVAKPIMKWKLRKSYLDMENDPEHYEKYALALDSAEPRRSRKALNPWYGNKTWHNLSQLENKCTLVVFGKDGLHASPKSKEIADRRNNLTHKVIKTHSKAHDKPLVDLIESLTTGS